MAIGKNNHRILVIEDDQDTNDLISTILEDAGFKSLPALDGEQGIEKARAETPDVILLDLMLPTIDGIEVCRRLMADEKTRSIPVIVLTAKQELSTKLSSFVAGAKRFLTKPFDENELISEIQRTIRQKELQHQNIESPVDPRD